METTIRYTCGGRVFDTFAAANSYADFMFRLSGIILGIEQVGGKP
jgi:hypothetical protein